MLIFLSLSDAVGKAIEGAFGGSLSDILIQIIATLILVAVVKIFFWSRITNFLEKRRELVQNELEDAKTANAEAQLLFEKKNKEYLELRAMAKDYLDKAKQKGEKERKEIIAKAKADANNIFLQAEKEIEQEKQKARTSIKNETVSLATLIASKIIEKELDENNYQNLVIKNVESSENI